jgi:hypothetical protein
VATATDVPLRSGKVRRRSRFPRHAGVAKDAPVGFAQIRLGFEVDTDAPQTSSTSPQAHRALLCRLPDDQERPAREVKLNCF